MKNQSGYKSNYLCSYYSFEIGSYYVYELYFVPKMALNPSSLIQSRVPPLVCCESIGKQFGVSGALKSLMIDWKFFIHFSLSEERNDEESWRGFSQL